MILCVCVHGSDSEDNDDDDDDMIWSELHTMCYENTEQVTFELSLE